MLRYINITIEILVIIYHPVYYLKHDSLKTRFSLRLQLEATHLGAIERIHFLNFVLKKERLVISRIVVIVLIKFSFNFFGAGEIYTRNHRRKSGL
jgi:hypothetical protein